MTMIDRSKLSVLRCKKCNQKLCEYELGEGTIQVLCMYNAGKGVGACRTLNIVNAKSKNNNKISKDAI